MVLVATVPNHLKRLRAVLAKLKEAGLKLKPSKCEFFKKRIHYLGHVVSEDGVETDPKKLEAIVQWPRPRTVTDVRSFLGFTNHYRRFIAGYAKVAKPLYKLTSGENASKKKQEIEWNEQCETAFQKLKEICASTPVLQYADYKKPFTLFTDASESGLGAVLCQDDENGKKKPVAYASRTLSQSEHNYDAHKLEFLALKWSVTEQFHDFQVLFFVMSTDVIRLPYATFIQNLNNCFAMILNIEPVADVEAIAVDRQCLVVKDIINHQGDKLFRKLVWPVVIRAIGNCHRQTIGVMIRAHQMVAGSLGGSIWRVRRIRDFFGPGRLIRS